MTLTVYMPALGAMGAALAARLVAAGVQVVSDLDARGANTRQRAAAAGVVHAPEYAMTESDIVLSVAPPDQAMPIAERFAALARSPRGDTVFADMNAISPQLAVRIGEKIEQAGARFADGGIIGLPPDGVRPDPALYVSGPAAPALSKLGEYGLRICLLDAPAGAASALKLSYAGITKGLIGIGAAMMLAATRAGVADALSAELAASQPRLLESFGRSIPDMMPKAARWVSEMHEIARFVGDDRADAEVYSALAAFYEHIGREHAQAGTEVESLRAFLSSGAPNNERDAG